MHKSTLAIIIFLFLAGAFFARGFTVPPTPASETQTFHGPTYTVPPGVQVRIEDPFTATDAETPCDNWPNTPTQLPCYIELHAVATDNQGAQTWDLQKWVLTAAPTPTPSLCELLPNGKCRKN